MKLTNEQATRIASSVLISDVISFVNEHHSECEEFFKAEFENANITKEELTYELKLLGKLIDANS